MGLMHSVGDVHLINPDGLWYLVGMLAFLHAAYHDLVVSRKDVLFKLLVDDYIQRSVASESARIAEQIMDINHPNASQPRTKSLQ